MTFIMSCSHTQPGRHTNTHIKTVCLVKYIHIKIVWVSYLKKSATIQISMTFTEPAVGSVGNTGSPHCQEIISYKYNRCIYQILEKVVLCSVLQLQNLLWNGKPPSKFRITPLDLSAHETHQLKEPPVAIGTYQQPYLLSDDYYSSTWHISVLCDCQTTLALLLFISVQMLNSIIRHLW